MNDQEQREESLIKGHIPEDSFRFTYHGEDGVHDSIIQPAQHIHDAAAQLAEHEVVQPAQGGDIPPVQGVAQLDQSSSIQPVQDMEIKSAQTGATQPDQGDIFQSEPNDNTQVEKDDMIPSDNNVDTRSVPNNDDGGQHSVTPESPTQITTTGGTAATLAEALVDNIMAAHERLQADASLMESLNTGQRDSVEGACLSIAYAVSMARRQPPNVP